MLGLKLRCLAIFFSFIVLLISGIIKKKTTLFFPSLQTSRILCKNKNNSSEMSVKGTVVGIATPVGFTAFKKSC